MQKDIQKNMEFTVTIAEGVKYVQNHIFEGNFYLLSARLSCLCPSANGQRRADQTPTL